MKHNQRPHFLHSFKSPTMAFRNVIIGLVWIATALVYYGIVIALSDQASKQLFCKLCLNVPFCAFQSTPGRAMFVGNVCLHSKAPLCQFIPTNAVLPEQRHCRRHRVAHPDDLRVPTPQSWPSSANVPFLFLLSQGRKWSQVVSLISAGTLIFAAMCLSLREEMTFSLLFMLAGKAAIQGAFNILYM
jgi:hypothetical protein